MPCASVELRLRNWGPELCILVLLLNCHMNLSEPQLNIQNHFSFLDDQLYTADFSCGRAWYTHSNNGKMEAVSI